MSIVQMEPFGFHLYRNGIVFHSDRRKRLYDSVGRPRIEPRRKEGPGSRGKVRGYSKASRRRFEFRLMNLAFKPAVFTTLTYHAAEGDWSTDAQRNAALARQGKGDLHRYLACLRKRKELGVYLWVQEFQQRGVVHFHILSEKEIAEERVREVWCRIIGAVDDRHALRYGVKVERVREDRQVRSYLSTYLGKGSQKSLPPGVEGAGRWWGVARTGTLALVDRMYSCYQPDVQGPDRNVRVVRGLRKYVSRVMGFKFKGGGFVVWRDAVGVRVVNALSALRQFYGVKGVGFSEWGTELAREIARTVGIVSVRRLRKGEDAA